jgi:predicted nucleic-acid-binding protein
MKITADANVLLRAVVGDDERQSRIAQRELAAATAVALTIPALCEFVWVLRQGYKLNRTEIASGLRRLVESETALADLPAVEAGLAQLEAGGDFADGVIAYQGAGLGADAFVSFDRRAVARLAARGLAARRLG